MGKHGSNEGVCYAVTFTNQKAFVTGPPASPTKDGVPRLVPRDVVHVGLRDHVTVVGEPEVEVHGAKIGMEREHRGATDQRVAVRDEARNTTVGPTGEDRIKAHCRRSAASTSGTA